jgi:hypothetical protein
MLNNTYTWKSVTLRNIKQIRNIENAMWLSHGSARKTNFFNTISLMKQQFVATHTIRQTEIFALLDSWVRNTPSVKMLCPQKKKNFLLVLKFS